jgi:GntR family transcriptional regulator/MocR family aminotransferase
MLREQLREAVRSARLAPGTRLPSSRELAADLRVSRGLVTGAYEQLTAEGYLSSARGSGTWVSGAARTTGPVSGAGRRAGGEPRADFRPGTPDLTMFPRTAWAAAHRRALASLSHDELRYPDPRGLPELRRVLAEMLTRRRGVVARPERVVVCSGVSQALTLLSGVFQEQGRPVAVESPGPPEHEMLFAAGGVAAVRVPMDAAGMVPAELARSGAGAAVLTPSHQFPLGLSYPASRRAELLAWARETDGLLIEDDYDGEFRYDRAPVGALQGLDPDRVVYLGSVSKSLAPGLRLGWMVVPEALAGELANRKRMMDLGHPVLDQALFADFAGRGDYDRQLRRCQRAYRERRDVLTAALAEYCSGAEVSGIAAGLHVIVTLPARFGPEAEFLARAGALGVAVRPLSDYGGSASPDGRVRIVLGYAQLAGARIGPAVRLLAGCDAGASHGA